MYGLFTVLKMDLVRIRIQFTQDNGVTPFPGEPFQIVSPGDVLLTKRLYLNHI